MLAGKSLQVSQINSNSSLTRAPFVPNCRPETVLTLVDQEMGYVGVVQVQAKSPDAFVVRWVVAFFVGVRAWHRPLISSHLSDRQNKAA